MKSYVSYTVTVAYSGLTVEHYLKQILHYSGRKIQKLTRQKGILVNNKPVFLQKKLRVNEVVRILIEEDTTYGVQPEQGSIDILYEDDYLFVINKPPYQLVHPAGQTSTGTTANFLAGQLQERGTISVIRPLHRLDRDTSGCIIFAKDAHSQFQLEQQLKESSLKRIYWALVKGVPTSPFGSIIAPIGHHKVQQNRRVITEQGESAITHYRTLSESQTASLLELTLETGRTHQIRLHLAHIGCPILGDSMYGIRSPLIKRQALHATAVSFHHVKEKKSITVQAPLLPDFLKVLSSSDITPPD